jgi:ribose 5-phosphate isomerase B
MKIALGCDHGGYDLMQVIKKHLDELGIEYKDFGTYSKESCHYPVFGRAAAEAVASGECDRGIIICTTGIGISITANKVHGIRAALCCNEFTAEMTRRHNDANMLAMGAKVVDPELAVKMVDLFLNTPFEGGRHAVRVEMMMAIEKEYVKK